MTNNVMHQIELMAEKLKTALDKQHNSNSGAAADSDQLLNSMRRSSDMGKRLNQLTETLVVEAIQKGVLDKEINRASGVSIKNIETKRRRMINH